MPDHLGRNERRPELPRLVGCPRRIRQVLGQGGGGLGYVVPLRGRARGGGADRAGVRDRGAGRRARHRDIARAQHHLGGNVQITGADTGVARVHRSYKSYCGQRPMP